MPTIHIQDDDTDFIMSIVSLIMGSDQVPASIVIDNSDLDDWTDEDAAIAAANQASWDFIAQRDVDQRAAEAAEAALAAPAATEQHPLVTEVINAYLAALKAAKRREAKAAKAEIKRREKSLIMDVIGSVACPTCHSLRGHECATPGGAGYGRTFVHNARRQAMNAAHGAVQS
jgi:hypothetical protein